MTRKNLSLSCPPPNHPAPAAARAFDGTGWPSPATAGRFRTVTSSYTSLLPACRGYTSVRTAYARAHSPGKRLWGLFSSNPYEFSSIPKAPASHPTAPGLAWSRPYPPATRLDVRPPGGVRSTLSPPDSWRGQVPQSEGRSFVLEVTPAHARATPGSFAQAHLGAQMWPRAELGYAAKRSGALGPSAMEGFGLPLREQQRPPNHPRSDAPG